MKGKHISSSQAAVSYLCSNARASPWSKHADGVLSLERTLHHYRCAPTPQKQMPHGFLPESQWKHLFALIFTLRAKQHNSGCGNVKSLNGSCHFYQSSWPLGKHRAHVRHQTARCFLLPLRETWSCRPLFRNIFHHYLLYKLSIQMYIL